jgi:hypothetical protein
MTRRWPTTALLLLATLCGCAEEAPPARDTDADLDRLRSLPYVGFSDPEPGREESGVIVYDRSRSHPGYTLYTLQMLCRAEMVDEGGTLIHSWSHEPCGRWERGDLLPDGDLIVVGADPSGRSDEAIPDATRYLLRLDWNGRVQWKRYLNAHHDVTSMAGNRFLALTFQRRRVGSIDPRIDVRDDQLALLNSAGEPLETRSLLEAFDRGRAVHRLRPTPPTSLGVRPWVDLFHSNSVQWIERTPPEGGHPEFLPGRALVCLRHQDCVALLDWEARRVVWAWGSQELQGPHDARILENGNLLVFDNGLGRGWSRVLELNPVTERIVWEYRAADPPDFFTMTKGSNQRLPNGNTLIADSDAGVAFEVTLEGDIVWVYRNGHGDGQGRRAAIVRATRYERELIDSLRDLCSGGGGS